MKKNVPYLLPTAICFYNYLNFFMQKDLYYILKVRIRYMWIQTGEYSTHNVIIGKFF